MKRRNFLKTVLGVIGAAVVGLKAKSAPVATAAPVSAGLPVANWIADEACDPDRIYMFNPDRITLFMSPAQHAAYKRSGYPSTLFQFVDDGGSAAMMSRVSYPDLSAPAPDANGRAVQPYDFEKVKKPILGEKVR